MRTLLQLNVLIAAGAASIALAGPMLLGRQVEWGAAVVAFAVTFAVYNFDRLADTSVGEGDTTPERAATMRRTRAWLVWLIPMMLLGALGLAALHGIGPLIWSLAFPALGFAYVLPILPRRTRPKNVPYLKCFYTAGCWSLFVGIGLSFTAEGVPALAFPFFVFVFLRTFVSTHLGDIRDAEIDAAEGMTTIANRFSLRANKRLLNTAHLAAAVFVVSCVASGAMPVAGIGWLPPCVIGFTCYRLWLQNPQHGELLLELYDLELLLFAPCVYVIGAWFGWS